MTPAKLRRRVGVRPRKRPSRSTQRRIMKYWRSLIGKTHAEIFARPIKAHEFYLGIDVGSPGADTVVGMMVGLDAIPYHFMSKEELELMYPRRTVDQSREYTAEEAKVLFDRLRDLHGRGE